MKNILYISTILLLISCGSKDKAPEVAQLGKVDDKGQVTQSTCKDTCLSQGVISLELNKSQLKMDEKSNYKISLCRDDAKKDCSGLDEMSCQTNVCVSSLGIVAKMNKDIIQLNYQGFINTGYRNILLEEITK